MLKCSTAGSSMAPIRYFTIVQIFFLSSFYLVSDNIYEK
jgi:hypothetical protein